METTIRVEHVEMAKGGVIEHAAHETVEILRYDDVYRFLVVAIISTPLSAAEIEA